MVGGLRDRCKIREIFNLISSNIFMSWVTSSTTGTSTTSNTKPPFPDSSSVLHNFVKILLWFFAKILIWDHLVGWIGTRTLHILKRVTLLLQRNHSLAGNPLPKINNTRNNKAPFVPIQTGYPNLHSGGDGVLLLLPSGSALEESGGVKIICFPPIQTGYFQQC